MKGLSNFIGPVDGIQINLMVEIQHLLQSRWSLMLRWRALSTGYTGQLTGGLNYFRSVSLGLEGLAQSFIAGMTQIGVHLSEHLLSQGARLWKRSRASVSSESGAGFSTVGVGDCCIGLSTSEGTAGITGSSTCGALPGTTSAEAAIA